MSLHLNRELKYVIQRFAEDLRQEVSVCGHNVVVDVDPRGISSHITE